MNFQEYLITKKIDSEAFKASESDLWQNWKVEFEQMHVNSFTIQKLNLINPVRRKYPLKNVPQVKNEDQKTEVLSATTVAPTVSPTVTKPAVARPVFKPKPKIN